MTTARSRSADSRSVPPAMGLVSLVGAGPGDPDLLTWRAIERLKAADVVFYDGLVPPALLRLAARAEHVTVARRAGAKTLTQDDVNRRLIDGARRGQRVVRLKSGDPFVFGRGGEEALALAAAGVPFEVVPGVSSAIAAPALAGIPVTHRGLSAALVVVSGHAAAAYAGLLTSIAPGSATIVVLMGLAERGGIRRCLAAAGWPSETPAAIVRHASRPDQHVWLGTLETLDDGHEPADASGDEAPGVIVIGQVVSLATVPDVVRVCVVGEERETAWQP